MKIHTIKLEDNNLKKMRIFNSPIDIKSQIFSKIKVDNMNDFFKSISSMFENLDLDYSFNQVCLEDPKKNSFSLDKSKTVNINCSIANKEESCFFLSFNPAFLKRMTKMINKKESVRKLHRNQSEFNGISWRP